MPEYVEHNDILRVKYIELMSDISKKYTKTELCKILNISRMTLDKFLRLNKDLDSIIHSKLQYKYNALGNKSLKRLFDIIDSTKNPKILELGLKIGQHYVDEVTNNINTVSDDNLDKQIRNIMLRAKNKRDKE
jgi:hypothetical protein